jgi:hypothetical protein
LIDRSGSKGLNGGNALPAAEGDESEQIAAVGEDGIWGEAGLNGKIVEEVADRPAEGLIGKTLLEGLDLGRQHSFMPFMDLFGFSAKISCFGHGSRHWFASQARCHLMKIGDCPYYYIGKKGFFRYNLLERGARGDYNPLLTDRKGTNDEKRIGVVCFGRRDGACRRVRNAAGGKEPALCKDG